MKKLLILGIVFLILFLAAGPALAWYRHGYGHRYHGHSRFGVFIGPPVIFVPPPPPVRYYYYRSYPPDDYSDYYEQDDRVWVAGHMEYRETPYGWKKVWVPGHWEWR